MKNDLISLFPIQRIRGQDVEKRRFLIFRIFSSEIAWRSEKTWNQIIENDDDSVDSVYAISLSHDDKK